MLYATYAEWLSGVRDWLDADHLTDDQIGAFISLAQDRMNRELAAYEMEATANAIVAGGVVPLPTDFNRIRQVTVAGVGTYEASTKGALADAYIAGDNSRNLFAIDAGQIYFYPLLTDGQTVSIDYYMMVQKISPTEPVSIFTASFSDMLLWAALAEGSNFIVEDDRAQLYEGKYATALEINNQKSKKVKMGSTPLRRFVRAI